MMDKNILSNDLEKVDVFIDTLDNFHPYECDHSSCIHCNHTKTKTHDPLNCELCKQ